ncbi:site-specific integrase [Amycolatopsis sp. DSM 110486]|uniref:tyrosine-type recombinase/integrase n=1 Tax=Amycolatopsis sp. DSM 110486 TaxID=2865832 RepID=UPI001C69AE40|nr:site-specific integrase [Amycolatopsis sp. DSM 110486]QYN17634.1 site-specific integrase [Amycolatopsis sp. DSM 110486]
MASIETRTERGRGANAYPKTVFRVVWYDPHTRSRERMKFDDEEKAGRFKDLLEKCGHRLDRAAEVMASVETRVPSLSAVIERHVSELTGIQERTRQTYRRDAKLHIAPYLGNRPINMVDRSDIKKWLNTLDDKGNLSSKSIGNVHGLLSAVFKSALYEYKLIDENPCKGIRLPSSIAFESTFLTYGEFNILVSHVRDHFKPVLHTFARTGLRFGELVALQVRDVDLLAATPSIRVTKARKRKEGGTYIGPPKTPRARRTISLPPSLVDILVPLVSMRSPDELLFTGVKGGPIWHSKFQQYVWKPAVEAATATHTKDGVPIPPEQRITKKPRIHDLRHTHASWQISEGVDLMTVQRRLGHESITTTVDRYGHLVPDQLVKAALAAEKSFLAELAAMPNAEDPMEFTIV